MAKKFIGVKVEEETFKAFKQICKANKLKLGDQVEVLMKEFIKSKEVTP